MNISKSSSTIRLIAFFLVAATLICTFGFTVDGWSLRNKNNGITSSNENNNEIGDTGLETPSTDLPTTNEPEIYIPEFVNSLTGLETSEQLSKKRPIAIVMNSDSALYATSRADFIAEFPIEDGSARMLAFITDTNEIGKIGSISSGRNYILNISRYYGALPICYGIEDLAQGSNYNDIFDLTKYTGYHYSEYTQYQYTNDDLLAAGIKNASIDMTNTAVSVPYLFNPFGSEPVKGDVKAENIRIAFSDSSVTELKFSKESRVYTYLQNDEVKKDLLNDNYLSFSNCLVLFADSITYEDSNGTQMVMNTIGKGIGYYFTEGTVTSISWNADTNNGLTILTESGDTLTINRGKTYVAFVKSSKPQSVTFK